MRARPVLAGAVRTTLEVLFCLRGQCNAQGTGLTHGTAGAVVLSHNLPFICEAPAPSRAGPRSVEYWPPRLTPAEIRTRRFGRCCTAVGRRARGRVPRSYITDTRTDAGIVIARPVKLTGCTRALPAFWEIFGSNHCACGFLVLTHRPHRNYLCPSELFRCDFSEKIAALRCWIVIISLFLTCVFMGIA